MSEKPESEPISEGLQKRIAKAKERAQLPIPEDRYVSERELTERTSTSPRMWQSLRERGGGPPFVRLSARCVRYKWGDVERWLEERTRVNTVSDD